MNKTSCRLTHNRRQITDEKIDVLKVMEWMLATPLAKKRSRDVVHVPIDQLIQTSRARVHEEVKRAPQLRQRLDGMDAKLAMLPDGRWYTRIRRDLEHDRQMLADEIHVLESGEHMCNFEKQIANFTRAYNCNESSRSRVVSSTGLPGERVNTFRVEKTSTVQLEVIDEYLTSVDNNVPRIAVARSDTCPRCNGAHMKLVSARALVTCTVCGYSASYLDATTSSISYGDDIEFANFSYKRINHFSEWLSNIQGIETYEVPEDVLEQVCNELYRQRICEADVTFKRVRETLKTLIRIYWQQ